MALAIGSSIPIFSLPATDGKTYGVTDLMGRNATVIMFWCNHCPYVIPNQERVIAMQSDYIHRGVNFAAICANNAISHPEDSFANMKHRAERFDYNFPYLHDERQKVAKAFGAERTPEVFMFTSDGTLCYRGRIDDNHENVRNARNHDLRNAIEAVLNGCIPDPSQTGAYGCTIKWK